MFIRPLAVVALAFVGSACSGTTSTSAEDGGASADAKADAPSDAAKDAAKDSGVSITEACTDRATAQCDRIATCRPAEIQIRYGTEDACVSGLKENCEGSLSAPSNGNDATLVEACAKAYPTWSCADFENDVNVPTACKPKTGSLKAGASCAFPGQCESGFCAIDPSAQCGTCKDTPAAGDSCANLTTCGSGLVCASTTQTCAALGAKGDACGSGAPCGYQLSCVGASAKTMTQGKCQPAVEKVGAMCDATQQTSAGCDLPAGLTCDATTSKCVEATIAAAGKPCGKLEDQQALCGAGGACDADAGAAGTCLGTAAVKKACDDDGGLGCVPPERCIVADAKGTTGTCQFDSADTCK